MIDVHWRRPDEFSFQIKDIDAGPMDGIAEHALRRLHLVISAVA